MQNNKMKKNEKAVSIILIIVMIGILIFLIFK
jgi:hypothetical protein